MIRDWFQCPLPSCSLQQAFSHPVAFSPAQLSPGTPTSIHPAVFSPQPHMALQSSPASQSASICSPSCLLPQFHAPTFYLFGPIFSSECFPLSCLFPLFPKLLLSLKSCTVFGMLCSKNSIAFWRQHSLWKTADFQRCSEEAIVNWGGPR